MTIYIQNIFCEVKNFYIKSEKCTFFLTIALCLNIIGFIPTIPQPIIYFLFILCTLHNILKKATYKTIWLILLIYIPINILITSPPTYFQSWQRYIFFALLIINVSPMINSKKLRTERLNMLIIIIYICIFLGVGSFFAKFVGLNFMHSSLDTTNSINAVGLFGGLTKHSMLLGPISGIATAYSCYKAITYQKKYFWLIATLCMMSVLFSASRSAFAATLIACLVIIYKLTNIKRFINYLAIIFLIFIIAYPAWKNAASGIIEKQQRNIESGSQFSSRAILWEARLDEFKNNPLCGVGFVSIDEKHSGSYINKKNGNIEPGSSWLVILSMTGILGTIIIIPIFLKTFLFVWTNKNDTSVLFSGLLSFFYIHMIAEGYIFSAGNFLCFTLWLVIGCSYDQKYSLLDNSKKL